MDPKIIGKNIRQHRIERHLTQEALATIAGIDVRTIQRAENGHKIAIESLRTIANAFEITIDQLSKDSQEEALKEFRSKYAVIELTPLGQAADLCRLYGTDAFHFQRIGTFTDEQADSIAEFEQLVKDYGECWSELEPLQRREAEKSIQPHIEQLHSLELSLSNGVQSMKLKSAVGVSEPFAFSILYIAVVPGRQPLGALIRKKGTPLNFA